jgi:precorrin-2/cobalt-factor-2 C20-methyltransferase
MYLFDRLTADWPVEIIPGVSSLGATAGLAGRPLALRDEPLAVLPGIMDDAALERLLDATEAAAILKVGRHVSRLKALLARLGLLETAVLVERATMTEARVRPLAEVMEERAPYFSLILTRRRGTAVF